MQTPDESNVVCANDFHDFLKDLQPSGQDPIFVLGNTMSEERGVKEPWCFLIPGSRDPSSNRMDPGSPCRDSLLEFRRCRKGGTGKNHEGAIQDHRGTLDPSPRRNTNPILISLRTIIPCSCIGSIPRCAGST